MIRDYKVEDFEAVKKLHEESKIDYRMPDLDSPLFLVKKVLELDGVVRAAYGMRIEAEAYLWIDGSDWASPRAKMDYVKELDTLSMIEAWLEGVDNAVCYVPPEKESFGRRIEKELGFSKPREGWRAYSKSTLSAGER